MQFIFRHGLILFLAVLVGILMLLNFSFNLYANILWFKAMDYISVLYTMVFSNLSIRIASFLFLFVFFFANLLITRRFIKLEKAHVQYEEDDTAIPFRHFSLQKYLNPKVILQIFLLGNAILAFVLSNITAGQWLTVQAYLNSTSFGIVDPVFNKDIGFYIFALPFYNLVYTFLVSAVIASSCYQSL